ncbi:MAG: hypothetical protein ACXVDF_24675, partial [Ktedonobacterales bacterium]
MLLAENLVGPLDELHQRLRCGEGGVLAYQVILLDPTGPRARRSDVERDAQLDGVRERVAQRRPAYRDNRISHR